MMITDKFRTLLEHMFDAVRLCSHLNDLIRGEPQVSPDGELILWSFVTAVHRIVHHEACLAVYARCADGWDYVFHLSHASDEVTRSIVWIEPQ